MLNAAHVGRFAGWALLGAATWHVDPWTGVMLVATRVPAVALVLVTFLQRRVLRPSPGAVAAWLAPTFLPVLGLCAALAWVAPPPAVVRALQVFVAACFAVLVFYALPGQIAQAARQPLGNLRWFQLALLLNYGWMTVYSVWVRQEGVELLMRSAYLVVFVEQALLVWLIERGVRAHRAGR